MASSVRISGFRAEQPPPLRDLRLRDTIQHHRQSLRLGHEKSFAADTKPPSHNADPSRS